VRPCTRSNGLEEGRLEVGRLPARRVGTRGHGEQDRLRRLRARCLVVERDRCRLSPRRDDLDPFIDEESRQSPALRGQGGADEPERDDIAGNRNAVDRQTGPALGGAGGGRRGLPDVQAQRLPGAERLAAARQRLESPDRRSHLGHPGQPRERRLT
jgi:hypothetical protein